LAAQQEQILSREQLAGYGVRRDHIRVELRAQRWQLIGCRAVVLHTGHLTEPQRWWAAVLNAGETAALCGITAAQVHGLRGFDAERVDVVVPRGTRYHPLAWVRVHESRRYLPGRDLHPVRRPPTVGAERALIDAAVWASRARWGCALLAAGVQQRLTTAERLLGELAGAGEVAHRRVLAASLLDIGGGAHALGELDLVRLCGTHGLPAPQRQVRRVVDGRLRYVDAEFEGLTVEIDGTGHLDPLTWWDDLDRQNMLLIDGRPVLRYPSVIVRLYPERVAAQIRAALEAVRRSGGSMPRSA
jgi:hypothetical protein